MPLGMGTDVAFSRLSLYIVMALFSGCSLGFPFHSWMRVQACVTLAGANTDFRNFDVL